MSASFNKTFSKQIAKFAKVSEEKADVAVRKIALAILANVVEGSPVDTGRFRGNWQIGIGTRIEGTLADEQKDTGAVVTREASKLNEVKAGGQIFITNSLPYARRLEFGWSQQAPQGMVRLTMRNVKQIVEDATK